MKRRQFLKAPAVTLLLPASGALGSLASAAETLAEPQRPASLESFPQRLHQDFITYRPGIEYFFLGNGDIHAIMQYQPDRTGDLPLTFLGVTLMDAERFSRKWSTYFFLPERGFERTMLNVSSGGKWYAATPLTFQKIEWTQKEGVPVVVLTWKAGDLAVTEEFFVPWAGGYLIRQVRVHNGGNAAADCMLGLALTPNYALFDDIGPDRAEGSIHGRGYTEVTLRCLDGKVETAGRYDLRVTIPPVAPGGEGMARFVYSIRPGTPAMTSKRMPSLWKETVAYWAPKPILRSGNATLDHLHAVTRSGMRSQLARSGKRDSGYWMYNMEWVRDDVMMMQALSMAGFHDEARTILHKILSKAIGPDGCAIESSRWSGYDLTELDQNGQILYAAWLYLCWTGDVALIKKYWKQIVLAGDFPLLEVFRDQKSGLLRNMREFWERDPRFGVEDGFELVYQFWVAYGLEKGAAVARLVGDAKTAARWEKEAARLTATMMHDPVYRFVEDGHLIKRRKLDGSWQRYYIPPNRNAPPAGSPLATIEKPEGDPDSGALYPIIYGMVPPGSELAKNTLAYMDILWNQRWDFGGYARYNTDSEPDPPGPWPIATMLAARAALEAGDHERVWRALNWVSGVHGGLSGAWFERYGPSITPPAPPVCVVGWTWAEIELFIVHHMLGFRPDLDGILIRPKLLTGVDHAASTFTIRGAMVEVEVQRGQAAGAVVNGRSVALTDGSVRVPYPRAKAVTKVTITVV
jgi:hypothetical protein